MSIRRILVGYDGTPQSERALEFALGISEQYEIEMHLVLVVQEPSGMADPIPDELIESLLSGGRETLSNAARLVKKQFGKPVMHLETGNPREKLLDLADQLKPDLIVVGMVKHSSSEKVLGTVSSYFIRSRKYPVLLVP
jgi:nucleotide-binding universal stress UspA family protein